MTKKRERLGALLLAILFFATSGVFSLLIILENNKQDDAKAIADQLQAAANNPPAEGSTKLEGTKLADFTPVDSVTSLQIIDLVPGNGDEVKQGATITAHYTGALAKDGTIFQSSHDSGQPFTSALSGLIQGWQEGIPGMKVGGTRRLLIPAAQAYGAQSQPGIPANSDLVFDIEAISTQ